MPLRRLPRGAHLVAARRRTPRGAALALALLAAIPAQRVRAQDHAQDRPHDTTTLQVTVANVRSGRGFVRVAVCPRPDFLQPSCPWKGSAPAQAGSVTVTIPGIPPGLYAAQAYQDETDIRRIPRSLFGIPEVGIGFSNDAPFHFGPPAFPDAAFRLGAAGGSIGFRLRYFD